MKSNLVIGCKVLVKDTVVKGVVTKIHQNKVWVLDQDGFEIAYLVEQLIIIEVEQSELSKFSDINHQLLQQKATLKEKSKTSLKKSKQEKYGVVMEVDLHIEKLVKSTKGLSNADILIKQIDTAIFKIEYAQKNRIPKMVFIHGVGEGVLKDELYRVLRRYAVSWTDASYQKYGLGATEITFLQ